MSVTVSMLQSLAFGLSAIMATMTTVRNMLPAQQVSRQRDRQCGQHHDAARSAPQHATIPIVRIIVPLLRSATLPTLAPMLSAT